MNRGIRVFGHPLHAILSDFPLALLGTSLLWDGIGILRNEAVWWAISFWDMAVGVAVALIAATVGAIDYAAIGQRKPALDTALRHMLYMLATVGLFLASLLVRRGPSPPLGTQRLLALIFEAIGVVLLSIGGWYGGHLVFHHGIGRNAGDPDPERHPQDP